MRYYEAIFILLTTSTMHIHSMDYIRQWGLPDIMTSVDANNAPSAQSISPQNIIPISALKTETDTNHLKLIKKWALPVGITCAGSIACYCLYKKLKAAEQKLNLRTHALNNTNTRYRTLEREHSTLRDQLRNTQSTSRSQRTRLNNLTRERDRLRQELSVQQEQLRTASNQLLESIYENLITNYDKTVPILENNTAFFRDLKNAKLLTLLHHAVRDEHLPLLEVLVKMNFNVNAPNIKGNIPLHYAAALGNISLVQYLLDNNADKNAKNHNNQTALDLARIQKHTDIIHLLEELDFIDKTLNLHQQNAPPHTILNLPLNTSKAAIKKRYYTLMKIWHPDRHKSIHAHQMTKILKEAYEKLS